MLEIEKKRKEEIDSKMNVSIDIAKGTSNLKIDEEDAMFSFGNQNIQANEFLNKTSAMNTRYKPFEIGSSYTQESFNKLEQIDSFVFKACQLQDEKSIKLYENMNP